MPKLNYSLDDADTDQLQKMRKSRDPVLCVIQFKMDKTMAEIVHKVAAAELPEGKTTVDLVREMLSAEDQYQNKPCILVMNYVCKNKRSGQDMDKMLVFKWIPDTCSNIRQKMVYSSAWEGFKSMLNSQANIQTANMFEAQDWDAVEDKINEA